tara:strand:+ start:33 stop:158 length:126 start_codon:yes stop_codon:yes gene_type:complete
LTTAGKWLFDYLVSEEFLLDWFLLDWSIYGPVQSEVRRCVL